MNSGPKSERGRPWIVYLVVTLLVAYGLYGPALLLVGERSTARISDVRRGGASEPQLQNRYFWSVGYEFTAGDGQKYGGHSLALSDSVGPRRFAPVEPVVYLPALPHLNRLQRDAVPGVGHAALFVFVVLLLWLTAPRSPPERTVPARPGGRTRGRAAGKTRAGDRHSPAPLSADQTAAWVRTYRRHDRLYASIFFVAMIPVVLGIIWWDVGVIDEEVLYSLAFFVVVFAALVLWSRRGKMRAWRGVVREKYIKYRRVDRGSMTPKQLAPIPVIKVATGGRGITLRPSSALFDYLSVGDEIFKLAGFDWPEKLELSGHSRACIVCGNILDADAAVCPRCRAPVPDHAALVRAMGRVDGKVA